MITFDDARLPSSSVRTLAEQKLAAANFQKHIPESPPSPRGMTSAPRIRSSPDGAEGSHRMTVGEFGTMAHGKAFRWLERIDTGTDRGVGVLG